MADVDIDPFGEHELRTEEPTSEDISLIPGEGGVPAWDPGHEQETSFRGKALPLESLKGSYLKEKVEELYETLSKLLPRNSEEIDFEKFEISCGELYYKHETSKTPLTSKGELKMAERVAEILRKRRLHEMGFDIPAGPMSPQKYIVLNRLEEELPSVSDLDKVDDIELQEMGKNATRSIENLNQQFEGQETLQT